jgi:hypothetical protein
MLAFASVQSKPYLPAIHLTSVYRERFGHPVCENVASRSLALLFFPAMRARARSPRVPVLCGPQSAAE